jgi:hypothetical protein
MVNLWRSVVPAESIMRLLALISGFLVLSALLAAQQALTLIASTSTTGRKEWATINGIMVVTKILRRT